uniref:Tripartite motif containing 66 n=1 Tax=Sinocyclocheilus grahami TaxID=75366 RepID=A0A672MN33_SINGR
MYLQCCSECSEPRMAQSLCTFCNKWLCFQCTDLHQHERKTNFWKKNVKTSPGAGCCGHAVVMCPLHKQEPLELLCETCDLMACSICHLSAHKDHRLVHVGKALQDQRWLLQNLMARVEEKRSAVESTAKQIQGRLHGIKITQRKAENQIKMAKMIMMNELNKRANLLIEQLEVITFSLQRLEDQLQGAIELCSQLEHLQNFITWATAHHRCNPLLFSKELIALQMQQLLEPLMLSEAWTPLKIKFNWDASFWTKQMSTLGKPSYWTMPLDGYFYNFYICCIFTFQEGNSSVFKPSKTGQLVVEGGSRSYPEVVGHPSILRPQTVPCIAMPPLCHAVREPGCACQTFCQPQLCCLHCRPTQSVPLDKFPSQCPQADASVLVHPPGAQPLQQSTSHPGSDPVQHGTSSASPRQPVVANNHPLSEPLPANSNQAAVDGRNAAPGLPPCERGQTSAPEAVTGQEASPDKELPQVRNQAQVQTTTETSNQPMIELQPIVARIDDDRVSFINVSLFICPLQSSTFALIVLDTDHSSQAWRSLVLAKVAYVESELLQESDPSAESELQVDSESDVISEQPPESVLSASEQEFESDPDSTAEVTLNLEPESEWEAEQPVLPPAAGSETISEPAVEHQPAEESPEIENEDFCAVCLIGGDLLCCDRCPKVFHLSCHVPPLHSFPIGDWICTLCRDVEQPEVEYDCENDQMSTGSLPYGLSACDQRKCEKLTLLILSNILSTPFHEPVSPLARHYYQIIKKPMDLSVIRNRLSRTSNTHYRSPQEFVADVLLMFKNCAKFNYPDSEVAQAGHSLQSFFTSKLREVFPDLTCPVQEEEDSDNEDYEELERAMATGFPWPERKEQSHRKRKRRHSLNWRRNHY